MVRRKKKPIIIGDTNFNLRFLILSWGDITVGKKKCLMYIVYF